MVRVGFGDRNTRKTMQQWLAIDLNIVHSSHEWIGFPSSEFIMVRNI